MSELHYAAKSGDYETLLKLLKDKADPLAKEENFGSTPLHIASGYCFENHVRALIEYGADVNVTDNDGWTPLHYAVRYGTTRLAKTGVVRTLIEAGANLDAKTEQGESVLYYACEREDEEIVAILISNGASFTEHQYARTSIHEYAIQSNWEKALGAIENRILKRRCTSSILDRDPGEELGL